MKFQSASVMQVKILNDNRMGHSRKSYARLALSIFERVTILLDERNAVGIVYLDFSKAFDKMTHDILVEKLTKYSLDQISVR